MSDGGIPSIWTYATLKAMEVAGREGFDELLRRSMTLPYRVLSMCASATPEDLARVGFYRFKFAGARPARGSLGDLLLAGQQTVAARSGPQASVLTEARVSVTEERGQLVVSVEDAKTLQLLLSDRPQRAVFRIEASGGKGVTREVPVEYDP